MTGINCPRLVIVLAGPTGAGKTTWAHRAGLDVLDWEAAGRDQDRYLALCAQVRYDPRARIVIERQLPWASMRETFARAVGADAIYVLAPPLDVVLQRIYLRGRKAMWHEMAAAQHWFATYEPADTHRAPPDPESLFCLP